MATRTPSALAIAGRCDKVHGARDAYRTILGSLPYTNHVFHRRGLEKFFLFLRVNLSERFVYLAAVIDDGAWRISTTQCKGRDGIAGFIKLDMVEINLSV